MTPGPRLPLTGRGFAAWNLARRCVSVPFAIEATRCSAGFAVCFPPGAAAERNRRQGSAVCQEPPPLTPDTPLQTQPSNPQTPNPKPNPNNPKATSVLWRKLLGTHQVPPRSPCTHSPQISVCLFASKPPLRQICLGAHRSVPMTGTQPRLPFLGRNPSYVSFQQIPIPQPALRPSPPCFVCLSSGSSWALLVIAPASLRTHIAGRGARQGRSLTPNWVPASRRPRQRPAPPRVDRSVSPLPPPCIF